jgi:hypothetical protein
VLPLVPPAGSARRQRPSLPWVLRGEFPSFNGTTALCDALCLSRRASLPSLGDTLRRAWRFAPNGPGHQTVGLGFKSGPHFRTLPQGSKQGLPGSRTTRCPFALFFDPGRTDAPGHYDTSAWPLLCPQQRLPRINSAFEAQSHGFRTRCLRFVRRVATQDAKLASGRWPSATGRDWIPAGL